MTDNVPDSVDSLVRDIMQVPYSKHKAKDAIQKHTDAAIRQAFADVLGELPEKATVANKDTLIRNWITSHENRLGFNFALDQVTALLKRRMER